MKLHPVAPLIESCLASLPALPVRSLLPEAAIGRIVAVPVQAGSAVPQHSIALRAGLAVTVDAVLGASPQSPVMVMDAPPAIAAGARMPAGCDALIDPDAVTDHGAFLEITESPVPGLHLRLAGSDLAAGTMIAGPGTLFTADQALAARLAGLDTVSCFDPSASLSGFPEPLAAWLRYRLGSVGIREAVPGEAATFVLATTDAGPRLALQPGESGWIAGESGQLRIAIPPRFDAALGLLLGALLPALMRWTGAALRPMTDRLARKISAAPGLSSLILLKAETEGLTPLALGDVTLASLTAADHFLLVPPGVEGFAAGDRVTVFCLNPLLASRKDLL
jgi:molybdopterin molybdotransferase